MTIITRMSSTRVKPRCVFIWHEPDVGWSRRSLGHHGVREAARWQGKHVQPNCLLRGGLHPRQRLATCRYCHDLRSCYHCRGTRRRSWSISNPASSSVSSTIRNYRPSSRSIELSRTNLCCDQDTGRRRISQRIHSNNCSFEPDFGKRCTGVINTISSQPRRMHDCRSRPHGSSSSLNSGGSRIPAKVGKPRQRKRRQNAQHHNHHDQLDQGETTLLLLHIQLPLWVCLKTNVIRRR